MIREGEIVFKLSSHSVTEETIQKVRKQIEYYFSLANLITDHFLRNIINCSKGGWVKIQVLTHFKALNNIIGAQVSEKLTNGQKKIIITKSCQKSSILEVNNFAIRRNDQKAGVKDFSNVIYCENMDFGQICNLLVQFQVNLNDIFTQKGNRWFFIEFVDKGSNEVEMITESLVEKTRAFQNVRILKGNYFVQLQKQYENIIGIIPLQSNTHKSQQKQFLKSNRIFSYDEVVEMSQPKKTKIVKLKGKLNKSRLPRKYIFGHSQKNKSKMITKPPKLIHIQGCTPKDKRSDQERRNYQKQKMEQRLRQKKELNKKYESMQIEKQSLGKLQEIISAQ